MIDTQPNEREEPNTIEAEEETPPEQEQTQQVLINRGDESLQIKLPNGLELIMSSKCFALNNICDMALLMIELLNGKEKPQDNKSYTG